MTDIEPQSGKFPESLDELVRPTPAEARDAVVKAEGMVLELQEARRGKLLRTDSDMADVIVGSGDLPRIANWPTLRELRRRAKLAPDPRIAVRELRRRVPLLIRTW